MKLDKRTLHAPNMEAYWRFIRGTSFDCVHTEKSVEHLFKCFYNDESGTTIEYYFHDVQGEFEVETIRIFFEPKPLVIYAYESSMIPLAIIKAPYLRSICLEFRNDEYFKCTYSSGGKSMQKFRDARFDSFEQAMSVQVLRAVKRKLFYHNDMGAVYE